MADERHMEDWIKKLTDENQDKKFDRRSFLKGTGKIAGLSLGMVLAQSIGGFEVNAAPKFQSYPFTLGVASGDPLPDGVVLWTRLAPEPLNGGGMPGEAVPVKWEIARDERFRHIVQHGTELARPDLAHSVHVEVSGLKPDQVYYYRFKSGYEFSPIGRTKTLPAAGSAVKEFKVCLCVLPAV